jgi:integrase
MLEINDLQSTTNGSPEIVNRKVQPTSAETRAMPCRPTNKSLRAREFLEPGEVDALRRRARLTRNPDRDEALVLLSFRHGLRACEAVNWRWEQIKLREQLVYVPRAKEGIPSTHPMERDEVQLLRRLYKDNRNKARQDGALENASPFVFLSERGGPMTEGNFLKLVKWLGEAAELPFPAHPHMLRHSCGYFRINNGWDIRHLQLWLGHKTIQQTMRYAELSDEPFRRYYKIGGRTNRHMEQQR